MQVTQENNQFARDMYDQNAARLDPYASMGIPAGDEFMGLLLGHAPASSGGTTANGWARTPAPASAPAAPGSGSANAAPYSAAQIAAMANDGIPHNSANATAANQAWYASHPNGATTPAPATPAPATPAHPATPSTAGAAPGNAFATFYNSPAFQLPLKSALEGINTQYAAKGAIESGAAMKAIGNYEHDYAAGVLGQYMDNLYRQEALGAGAASSLAGVGQNLVSQVSANNNNAGSAAANAALARGQASAGQWNAIGGAIGQVAGAVGGAFGQPQGSSYDWGAAYNNANQAPWTVNAYG